MEYINTTYSRTILSSIKGVYIFKYLQNTKGFKFELKQNSKIENKKEKENRKKWRGGSPGLTWPQ
jgi:hypothetical protein